MPLFHPTLLTGVAALALGLLPAGPAAASDSDRHAPLAVAGATATFPGSGGPGPSGLVPVHPVADGDDPALRASGEDMAADPAAVAIGAALYGQFCAGCHGAGGRGDGPLAPLITAGMPDLTRLSRRNDGVFPMLAVVRTIDGRTRLAAHGGPMPVWGEVFRDAGQIRLGLEGSALEVQGRIMALTLYLEAIQD